MHNVSPKFGQHTDTGNLVAGKKDVPSIVLFVRLD